MMMIVMEDDIKTQCLIFWDGTRRLVGRNFTAPDFLKFDGRFYREFEYLCVGSHHYSEPNE
jgi:hypothetical protein